MVAQPADGGVRGRQPVNVGPTATAGGEHDRFRSAGVSRRHPLGWESSATSDPADLFAAWLSTGGPLAGQEARVLSMLWSADFSDDCRVRAQLYFTVIDILL